MKNLVRIVVVALLASSLAIVGGANAAPDSCTGSGDPFTDVSPTSFAREEITCIFNLGVTTGTSDTTYSPNDLVTREQMASFLARLYKVLNGGVDAPVVATPFTDVAIGSFARDDIARIFGLGITTGTSDTTYSPGDNVTREQMGAFLARLYAALKGEAAPVVATPFTDIAGSFAADDIARIFGLGITTGTSDTTYSPADFVTREQMAAFLARLYEALEDLVVDPGPNPDPDPDPDPAPPELDPIAAQDNDEGTTVALTIGADDPNGDTLTFGASNLPTGLSINPSTGVISGTIASGAGTSSPFTVTVTVSDGNGGADAASFSWVVRTVGGPVSFADAVSYEMDGPAYGGKAPDGIHGLLDPNHGLVFVDLNGDDILDLASAISEPAHAVTVRFGNGDGTFGSPTAYSARSANNIDAHTKTVRAAHLNGDDHLDLVAVNQETTNNEDVVVFLNNGDGTFGAPSWFDTCPGAHDVNTAKLNGDDHVDVFVACTDTTPAAVTVLFGNGDGTLQTGVDYAPVSSVAYPGSHAVEPGDVNEDGHLDIVVANYARNTVGYMRNNGDGTFATAVEIGVGSLPHDVVLIDIVGDDSLDLVTADEGDNTVTIVPGNGDGTFGAPETLLLGGGSFPKGLDVADLNNDGTLDIVVANSHNNYNLGQIANPGSPVTTTVTVLLQNLDGTWEAPDNFIMERTPFAAAIADLNGDGKPDLGFSNWTSQDTTILLQD